jgi:hypothetical protein
MPARPWRRSPQTCREGCARVVSHADAPRTQTSGRAGARARWLWRVRDEVASQEKGKEDVSFHRRKRSPQVLRWFTAASNEKSDDMFLVRRTTAVGAEPKPKAEGRSRRNHARWTQPGPQLADLLASAGLAQHQTAFEAAHIDGQVAALMDLEDLKSLLPQVFLVRLLNAPGTARFANIRSRAPCCHRVLSAKC